MTNYYLVYFSPSLLLSVFYPGNEEIKSLKAFINKNRHVSISFRFGYSLSVTKKQDSKSYLKGIQPNLFEVHESGASLARRALLRATLYSVTGFSLFCVGVWKLSGASNFEEFRYTVGSLLPRITKPPSEQQGRTEFKSLTDFMQYLVDEDNKKKKRKEWELNTLIKWDFCSCLMSLAWSTSGLYSKSALDILMKIVIDFILIHIGK